MRCSKKFRIEGGEIIGLLNDDGSVNIFKGIPYAAPPVGSLRWKPPVPVKSWEGVRNCTEFSRSEVQPHQAPFFMWTKEFIISDTGYSEDCLYLNLWVSNDEIKNKPVVFYIHGGGFVTGGSSCEIYDGEELAKSGVIFITLNFRLGIFGFLATSELSKESDRNISGNYHLLDMIAALKWVKRNIEAFGGDPENITLVGQSSGAGAVNNLVMSSLTKGLFERVLVIGYDSFNLPVFVGMKNGSSVNFPVVKPLKECEKYGDDLFKGRTPEELRKIPAEDLLKITQFECSFCLDNYVLTESFKDFVKSGRSNDINYILSFLTGDRLILPAIRFEFDKPETYVPLVKKFFGSYADEILKLYPLTDKTDYPGVALEMLLEMLGDFWTGSVLSFARARKAAGAQNNTWLLKFDHVLPGPDSQKWGVFHTADIPYLFKHFSDYRKDYWTEEDFEIGNILFSRLLNFVKKGNPNCDTLEKWEPSDGKYFYRLDNGVFEKTSGLSPEKNNFWYKFFGDNINLY